MWKKLTLQCARSAKNEDRARIEYQKDLDSIRNRRRQYREMLYDAMLERRRLMESMQIQRDEDDILRKKVCFNSASPAPLTLL